MHFARKPCEGIHPEVTSRLPQGHNVRPRSNWPMQRRLIERPLKRKWSPRARLLRIPTRLFWPAPAKKVGSPAAHPNPTFLASACQKSRIACCAFSSDASWFDPEDSAKRRFAENRRSPPTSPSSPSVGGLGPRGSPMPPSTTCNECDPPSIHPSANARRSHHRNVHQKTCTITLGSSSESAGFCTSG
jgi:hypothetical protein